MIKTILAAGTAAVMLAGTALAQDQKPIAPAEAKQSMPPLSRVEGPVNFVQSQSSAEWRASKIVGSPVFGPDNKRIGDINEIILDGRGTALAAVIGVGGFLGVGEKDVAVPFTALTITRKLNSDAIEKVMIRLTRQELNDAPRFTYLTAPQTTGANTPGALEKFTPSQSDQKQ